MEKLTLPDIAPRIRTGPAGKPEIFDPIRKRYVRLTPEEWVRQHFLGYMTGVLGYPATLIRVEAAIQVNRMIRRFDIVACSVTGEPRLVVECKEPRVEITQAVFDQAARYNMTLKADFLVVTNGLSHYACSIDHANQRYAFLEEVPAFEVVSGMPG